MKILNCERCGEDAVPVEWGGREARNYIVCVRRKSHCRRYRPGNTSDICSTNIHQSITEAVDEWNQMQKPAVAGTNPAPKN